MKKIILLLVLSLFCVTGCSDKASFQDKEWIRHDSDTEHVIFDSNGNFSAWCDCGNPVYDADICEKYTYNKKTQTITLKCMDGYTQTLKVIEATDTVLKLEQDGEVRTFKIEEEEEKIKIID